MIATTDQSTCDLQARFEQMLPQIHEQANHAFRGKTPELKEELIAEVIASAYCAFTRLAERGKLDVVYPSPLAQYAIRQAKVGRRVGTPMNSDDITSEYAQRRRGINVERLDRFDASRGCWKEAVVADQTTTPAELAAFRIDFPAWLGTLNDRLLNIVEELGQGERTIDVARRFRVSAGRISQLRRELQESWQTFIGELVECDVAAV